MVSILEYNYATLVYKIYVTYSNEYTRDTNSAGHARKQLNAHMPNITLSSTFLFNLGFSGYIIARYLENKIH